MKKKTGDKFVFNGVYWRDRARVLSNCEVLRIAIIDNFSKDLINGLSPYACDTLLCDKDYTPKEQERLRQSISVFMKNYGEVPCI